jgi:protein TonB
MFDQTFVERNRNTNKRYTIVFSLLLQISTICILVLVPLVYTQSLPNTQLKSMLVAPAPPPRSAAPPPAAVKITTRAEPRLLNAHTLLAPRVIPKTINPVNDIAAPDVSVFGATGADTNPNGGIPGILGSTTASAPPALVPPAKPKTASGPMRIGGVVAEANIIRKIQPVYPALARSARIQGTVEFTAIISKEGAIENLQLIHGHPLLVNAAREAVLEWRYRPTLLNGQPVEVLTTITGKFMLSQ